MATLTVRNLDKDLVRRLRVRAAEHGRSAEAEHREILREVLVRGDQSVVNRQAADRLTDFQQRTANRGSASCVELLKESRDERMRSLVKDFDNI